MATVVKGALQGRRPATEPVVVGELPVRRGLTVAIPVVSGLIVGMTSVGSGSLMIVLLPCTSPLVASAALGHLLFGDFQLSLTASLLIGSVPGVYAGARVSARAPDALIRPVLVVVLVALALKLLKVPTTAVGWFLVAASVAGVVRLAVRYGQTQGDPAQTGQPPA